MGYVPYKRLVGHGTLKVAKLTHTKVTPFWNGKPGNNWWYWFKCKHPKVSIRQVKALEVCKTQGQTQLL
jgi:hypothetical protein